MILHLRSPGGGENMILHLSAVQKVDKEKSI